MLTLTYYVSLWCGKCFINRVYFIDHICLFSLAQDEDCMGTPVKVQKTDTTTEPEIA